MKPSNRLAALLGASLVLAGAALVDPAALVVMAAYDAVLAVVLGVALVRRPRRGWVEVERDAPSSLVVRSEGEVTIVLRNTSARALRVVVRDTPPDALGARGLPLRVALTPGETRRATYPVHANRRGIHRFGDVWLRVSDVWGLVDVDGHAEAGCEIRVHPAPITSRGNALVLGRSRALAPGAGRARFVSEGALFEGLRPYVSGDDPRLVDWKATARRGTTVVREMRPERNQRIVLMLDQGRALSSGLDEGTKLDRAVEAAHQLALLGLEAGDEVGLIGFGAEPRAVVAPSKRSGQERLLLDALIGLEPEPVEPDYGAAFAHLTRLIRRRSLVVVFTDVMNRDSSATLIAHLGSLVPRHLPLCVTLEDDALGAVATGEARSRDPIANVYRQVAARELVEDQERALETLRLGGVLTVHVPAQALAAATMDRYLELKYRGQL